MKIKDFYSVLDGVSPFALSEEFIKKGAYDNSGIILDCGREVKKVLFSLDLSEKVVSRAVRLGCDTVVTHHPAIYTPVSSLSVDGGNSALLKCALKKINVISCHLNLDIADGGIDDCLKDALGGEKYKIIDRITDSNGYGRVFSVKPETLGEFYKNAKKTLGSDKIIVYGDKKSVIEKVASFCGAGSNDAFKFLLANGRSDADLIATSDVPHHLLKEFIEKGKSVMIIPHYVSESYGFKKYKENIGEKAGKEITAFFYDDKRFR